MSEDNEDQQDPRIVDAINAHAEEMAEMVREIRAASDDEQEACETSITQGFALGFSYAEGLQGSTPASPFALLVQEPSSLIQDLMSRIDAKIDANPSAATLLGDLRQPLQAYVQKHEQMIQKAIRDRLTGLYGRKDAELLMSGDTLDDTSYARITMKDIRNGAFDLIAYGAYAHRTANPCKCVMCMREAAAKSGEDQEKAEGEMTRQWPDPSKLFVAYGKNVQVHVRAAMTRLLYGANQEGHSFGHADIDAEKAEQIAKKAIDAMLRPRKE